MSEAFGVLALAVLAADTESVRLVLWRAPEIDSDDYSYNATNDQYPRHQRYGLWKEWLLGGEIRLTLKSQIHHAFFIILHIFRPNSLLDSLTARLGDMNGQGYIDKFCAAISIESGEKFLVERGVVAERADG